MCNLSRQLQHSAVFLYDAFFGAVAPRDIVRLDGINRTRPAMQKSFGTVSTERNDLMNYAIATGILVGIFFFKQSGLGVFNRQD